MQKVNVKARKKLGRIYENVINYYQFFIAEYKLQEEEVNKCYSVLVGQ